MQFSPYSDWATGWTVRGSNPGGGEIFRTRPDPPWGPPSLLYSGYRVFSGGKPAGSWSWPPTASSAEIEGRVELYICSPSGPSWPVLGWPLPLPVFVHRCTHPFMYSVYSSAHRHCINYRPMIWSYRCTAYPLSRVRLEQRTFIM
jgi:hypothetical protein